MSEDLSIFIQASVPLEVLAQELAEVLSVTWQPVQDEYVAFRALRPDQHWSLDLGTHALEDDGNLDFTAYPYQVDIHTINIREADPLEQTREQAAYIVFERLKALGKYALMLVEDVQIKRDVYNPETEAHFHG